MSGSTRYRAAVEGCEHQWQLVEVDFSEHGEIELYLCRACGTDCLSHGAPDGNA